MAAGRLRERVRFDRRAASSDGGYGTAPGDWATYAGPMAAEIKPLRSREQALAVKLEERNVVEIIVRYHNAVAGLANEDRAVNARTGKVYDIKAIENKDQRKRYLTILAESGGAIG